jgi:hypothetical protein
MTSGTIWCRRSTGPLPARTLGRPHGLQVGVDAVGPWKSLGPIWLRHSKFQAILARASKIFAPEGESPGT